MADRKPPYSKLTTPPIAPEEDRRYYVYQLVDTRALDVPLYIGKGTGQRLSDHAADARAYNAARAAGLRPRAGRLVCKHAKTLREGRCLVATKCKEGLTHKEALDHEAKLIATIGRLDDGGPLYNISAGGEGVDPAITSSAPHRKRAAKQIRRVNTDAAQVQARSNRLRALHADPKWHAAAVTRIHPANQNPETKARTLAAAAAGRHEMLADPVRRARLAAACSAAQRRRLALPAERTKHALVMRKVHAALGWRDKVTATSRAAHQRPDWQAAFERGMAKRDADGLHGARTREGLRRKRLSEPLFAAEASARGRAAMVRLHADPTIRARHRAQMAAVHRDPTLDAWRRARHRWHYESQRAAKAGIPPPPPPNREDFMPGAQQDFAPMAKPPSQTHGDIRMTTRTILRRYSVTAAKQPGQRSLAQLIRFHKKRMGATYRDIASAAGVSVATLWEVVHSVQVRPTIDTVHRLAFVLGFSLSEVAPPL